MEVRIERYNNGTSVLALVEDRCVRGRCEPQTSEMLSFYAQAVKMQNRRTWQALIE